MPTRQSRLHVEYPELLPETEAILLDAPLGHGLPVRRIAAAVLRAAMRYARDPLSRTCVPGFPPPHRPLSGAGPWERLASIADNLHSPPPPAPTLAEAREAARDLAGPAAEIVHRYLESIDG